MVLIIDTDVEPLDNLVNFGRRLELHRGRWRVADFRALDLEGLFHLTSFFSPNPICFSLTTSFLGMSALVFFGTNLCFDLSADTRFKFGALASFCFDF